MEKNSNKHMVIRIATGEDLEDIISLYERGLKELNEPYKHELLIKKVTESYILAPCFLVVINDKIVGMAGFTLVTTSHSGVASLADYMFFIEKEHRNIKTLDALMKQIKEFAMTHNLQIRLDFLVDRSVGVKKRLFERYGFNVNSIVGVYGFI